MRFLIIAVLAVAGMGAFVSAQENRAKGADAANGPEPRQAGRFAVWSAGSETGCVIAFDGEGELRGVDVGGGCGEVFAGLDRVADARFQPDGALQLSDAGGRVIIEFAPSEGFFMESVRPENALLALSEAGE